jgi:cobalamin biosynthesis protein CobD/CbiB
VVAASGPVDCVPLVANAPLQPPAAVHPVASSEDQVSVAAAPLASMVGAAVSVAVGTAATVTVVEAAALVPPGPVHESRYDVVVPSSPVLCVPLTAIAPLHPPDAVHVVAFSEDQVSVAAAPPASVVGVALNVTVGNSAVCPVEGDVDDRGVVPGPPHAAIIQADPHIALTTKKRMSSLAAFFLILAT